MECVAEVRIAGWLYLVVMVYSNHQQTEHKRKGTALKVHKLRDQLPVLLESIALATTQEPDNPGDDTVLEDKELCVDAELDLSATEATEFAEKLDRLGLEEQISQEDEEIPQDCIRPRSKRTLYKTLMAGQKLWQRPPQDLCKRCRDHARAMARERILADALNSIPSDVEYQEYQKVIKSAGGRVKAAEERRQLELDLVELRQHVVWKITQRAYVKKRRDERGVHVAFLYLDYGGFTDSMNKKVSA